MEKEILIAALVAIIAIGGLAILFSGAPTGQITIAPKDVYCPPGYELDHFVGGHGQMHSYVCIKPGTTVYSVGRR